MGPRELRAIDLAVRRFASKTPATKAALKKAVLATNAHEHAIDTISAEELFDKLVTIAERHGLDATRRPS